MAQLKTTNVHGDLHVSGEITQEGNVVITPDKLGDAMNAHVLGMGQTWQDVSESRYFNTYYTNTTGRPIFVSVLCVMSESVEPAYLMLLCHDQDQDHEKVISANGVEYIMPDNPAQMINIQGIIPAGSAYSVYGLDSVLEVTWMELR